MAIRKKWYLTTIKMSIALMIDKPNVKRQCAVKTLPTAGKAITKSRKWYYQPLVNIR